MTASPKRPGPVSVVWVTAVMALLLLAASLLFPLGAEGHARDGAVPARPVVAGQEFCEHGDTGHRLHTHELGNGWTPILTSRPGPAGEPSLVAVEPVVRPAPACAFPVTTADMPPGVDPASAGVLRV
ncbi:hypothetical protein [Actinoplanes couchii]|uniref:Secreted protein n=1 Tax=Actinoplanes couchii TaxID=403638 RepID=A0ABQ3XE88_9ACTN|nr:hypothetical protein [Actinoplanes couchii]MDR6317330.1 hypothetical protein [Actinoplanes couchii]GID56822.1 hypothetical protein Aco03nite_052260 [Actinoplanes couchii]